MNLRDLHYFVVLARVGHFGEAAKQCFVSQPTLSMQIKKLEEELGVLLFERDNKRVLITDFGRQLVSRAADILTKVAELKETARMVCEPLSGVLRLGVIPTVAPYLLPLVLPVVQQALPKLKIWLIEEKTNHLTEQLSAGDLDAAIMAAPIPVDFSKQALYDEPFYFACSSSSPMAKKTLMKTSALKDQSVMLLEEGHCLREQAITLCHLVQAETYANFTATSLETLRLMVQANYGVTLLPALAARQMKADQLSVIAFEKPAPSRTIALYWRQSSARVVCLNRLAELISATINPLLTESL